MPQGDGIGGKHFRDTTLYREPLYTHNRARPWTRRRHLPKKRWGGKGYRTTKIIKLQLPEFITNALLFAISKYCYNPKGVYDRAFTESCLSIRRLDLDRD